MKSDEEELAKILLTEMQQEQIKAIALQIEHNRIRLKLMLEAFEQLMGRIILVVEKWLQKYVPKRSESWFLNIEAADAAANLTIRLWPD